ncbi:leucine-rich repeat- and IQ domain-containing protein 1-like [Diadema antillarum]|uniref:leucine-rich repeat- and IQ domain-containing protein 1-like n=1 Tax=Diadema antillarum TaxID=105358 RepID=UPI003A8A0DCC
MSRMRGQEGRTDVDEEDEEAWIEAQIQRELDALSPLDEGTLSAGGEVEDEVEGRGEDAVETPNGTIPESVAQFLDRVKSRSQGVEQSLAEVNDLLNSTQIGKSEDVEEFAYKSKQLNEIAFQLGEDPEELRDRVIQELEEADEKDTEDCHGDDSSGGLESNGLDVVPALSEENGTVAVYTDINAFERQLQEKVRELEGVMQERQAIEQREREEAGQVMSVLDQNAERHRLEKQRENEREGKEMAQERLVQQARFEEELASDMQRSEAELLEYQNQIEELSRRTALEREAFEREHQEEMERQSSRQHTAATCIQAAFRSFRARKPYLKKMRMIREGLKESREHERQMEIVSQRKKAEQKKRKEKLEKMKKEEEERRRREEEEKRKEEERLEVERLERVKVEKEKKEKERSERERREKEEQEARQREELERQSEEILKKIIPDRQKVGSKAKEGEGEGKSSEGESALIHTPVPQGTAEAETGRAVPLYHGAETGTLGKQELGGEVHVENEGGIHQLASSHSDQSSAAAEEQMGGGAVGSVSRIADNRKAKSVELAVDGKKLSRRSGGFGGRRGSDKLRDQRFQAVIWKELPRESWMTSVGGQSDGPRPRAAGHGGEVLSEIIFSPMNHKFQLEHCPLEDSLEQRRLAWIQECISPDVSCTKLVSKAKLDSTSTKPRRTLRRPPSAKKLPALTDAQLASSSLPNTPLSEVTTVQLRDLPGCSLTSLAKCPKLRCLCLNNCGATALESLEGCSNIWFIDVSNNKVESLNCRDKTALTCLNAARNVLVSTQGLEGCNHLRKLDLSHNKITRLAGVETLLSLTHLDLSHNQLVNASGLPSLVHLQELNLSANHLNNVRGLDQCPLLQRVDLSSNSITEVPKLTNNVLLRFLSLAGNSLSSAAPLGQMWLPLLQHLDLGQNGLSEIPPMKAFLLLGHLSLCNNFISDVECLEPRLAGCRHLKTLSIAGNAVTEEPHLRSTLLRTLPNLQRLDSDLVTSGAKGQETDPRPSSFEVMCRSQVAAQDALLARHEVEISGVNKDEQGAALKLAEMRGRHLLELHTQAVDHRYMHEYGETSPVQSCSANVSEHSASQSLHSEPDKRAVMVPSEKASLSHQESHRAESWSSTQKGSHKGMETYDKSADESRHRVTGIIKEASEAATTVRSGDNIGRSGDNPGKSVDQQNAGTLHGKEGCAVNSGSQRGEQRRIVDAQTISKVLHRELKSDSVSLAHRAATLIQATWRGFSLRRDIHVGTQRWLAAVKIQSTWRGHRVRQRLRRVREGVALKDRGAADVTEEEDYGEVDLESFDFNEEILEKGWTTPSEMPSLVSKYPPLPPTTPSNRPHPASLHRPSPPSSAKPSHPSAPKKPLSPEKPQPRPLRQAWRGANSPLLLHHQEDRPQGTRDGTSPPQGRGGLVMTKPPLPPTTPSSLGSTDILSLGTPRTQRSARQEMLTEEWGFKDSTTAELMMRRAKKMAKGKKKKLDPIQRYQQIKKAQESPTSRQTQVASKKGVQRKEYFQAREEESEKKARSKLEENSQREERTFEWVHSQVNDAVVSDSRINPHGIRQRQASSEPNLPAMSHDVIQGSRVSLVSPNAMEVQSVDSAPYGGLSARGRSHSFSSPEGDRVQFPPIKTSSAPSSHTKQRMAERGGDRWGGGGGGGGGGGARSGWGGDSKRGGWSKTGR